MAADGRLGEPREVVGVTQDILGTQLLGAYLHGSATLGGLRPHSDIDVLCVTSGKMSREQRSALVHALLQISGSRAPRGRSRPVELTVVAQGDLRPWRYPPTCDFQYGEWMRTQYEAGVLPTRHVAPDLATLVTMVLCADAPVLGPPPSTLLDPVPEDDLSEALLSSIPGLLDELATDSANVLLTLARIWLTIATGRIAAKDVAAEWAGERVPPEQRPPLDHARAVYRGEVQDVWTEFRQATSETAAALARAIDEAAADRRAGSL